MFIEITGIDGSGKTTVAHRVRRCILDSGNSAWERSLRSVSKLSFNDIAAMYGEAHWSSVFSVEEVEMAHAVEMVSQFRSQVLPLDLKRQSIITDTYMWRWLATAQMWGASNVDSLTKVFSVLPRPDLSIRLSVDPGAAYQRILARPEGDSLLKQSDPSKVVRYAEAFDAVAPLIPYPTTEVDAGRSLDEVVSQVLERVSTAIADRDSSSTS